MLTERIKELEAAKAKVQDLEAKIMAERPEELAGLPGRYGFSSLNEFIKAVKAAVAACGGSRKRGRKAKAAVAATPRKAKAGKRGRARITDEVRLQVKQMVEAGQSGSEIAKALHISVPSIQNIKKSFGMVKARKEQSAPAEAAPEAAPQA